MRIYLMLNNDKEIKTNEIKKRGYLSRYIFY